MLQIKNNHSALGWWHLVIKLPFIFHRSTSPFFLIISFKFERSHASIMSTTTIDSKDSVDILLANSLAASDRHVDNSGLLEYLQQADIDLNSRDLHNVIESLDRNHDGQIDYSEVQAALGSVKSKEDLLKKTKLLSLFNRLDADLSGEISMIEWQNVFLDMKYNRSQFCIDNNIDESIVDCVDDVEDSDISLLFKSMDNDNSGFIEFNEFYSLFENSNSMKDLIHISKLKVIFNRIDDDLNGSLDLNEVRIIFENEGIKLTKSQISHLISIIDENNDGSIDFDEFKNAFDHVDNLHTLVEEWKSMLRFVVC